MLAFDTSEDILSDVMSLNRQCAFVVVISVCGEVLKLTLKFTLKCPFMFQFNKPSSGSLLSCFAKVVIIKIVS